MILFYEDIYYCLSNMSSHMVEYEGILYTTAEHAYQCQRFRDKIIKKQIQESKSAIQAKKEKLGHEL